jgi:ribosomal 50S subunit-recycling heat shock protein
MRIDKYLKLTRLIKRRTIAKELLERGEFKINDRKAKPSSEVLVGDILFLPLGRHQLTVKVLNVADYCKKDDSTKLYEIIKDEIVNEPNVDSK